MNSVSNVKPKEKFLRCLVAIIALLSITTVQAKVSQPRAITVEFSQPKIETINSKVKLAQLPSSMPGESWDTGPTNSYMKSLQNYWLNEYDWRETEQKINQFDNYKVNIEGEDLHYIKEQGSDKNATPLILLHGWPHNFMSFLDVIKPLAHPEQYGGNLEQAYTVIVVSLPGSGLSDKPATPLGPKAMASRLHKLMHDILGFEEYALQGGDWGALIGSWMAYQYPESISMLHLNHALLRPNGAWLGSGNSAALNDASQQEIAHMATEAQAFASPTATYFALQSTRPQSIAFALSDSPIGAAAWYVDKYAQWIDTSVRTFENVISKTQLLDQVMLSMLTETMDSAMWIYNGAAIEIPWTLPAGEKVSVPTVFAAFPDPFITPPPTELVNRSYNLVQWQKPEEGGHWPMMERPDLFVSILQEAQTVLKK